MPTVELSPPARLALIGMLLMSEKSVTNAMLDERFKIKIAKGTREKLEQEDFISARRQKPTSGPFFHELTDSGRAQARAVLSAPPPEKASGSFADVRLLYAIGKILDRVIRDYGLDEEKVFHPGSEPPRSIADDVIAAYQSLGARPGELVSLADLRDRLQEVDRDTLDVTLKSMDRQRTIQLEPEPNRKALTREMREAAVSLGGEDKHYITIGHR